MADLTLTVDGQTLTLGVAAVGLRGATGDRGPKGNQGREGPQGVPGPRGPRGVPGADGTNGIDGTDATPQYTHTQDTPSAVWVVNHNLGRYPVFCLMTTGGAVFDAEVVQVSNNQLQVLLAAPLAGFVRCT